MTTLIKLKSSLNTAIPGALANGEPAYTANGDVFYIGANGQIVPIGGKRVPGTLTANQAIVTNSTNMIDLIMFGNSTVNTVINSTAFKVANSTVTYTQILPTAAQQAGQYFQHANGSWVLVSSSTPGGSNTFVQFNDSTSLNGTAGFTFDKATNNMTLGNTITIGGSTIANSLVVQVGANSILNTTAQFVGNSTANAIQNQVTFALANSTVSSNLQAAQLNIGANAFINTTAMFLGNSTVNTTQIQTGINLANSTVTSNIQIGALNLGANVQVSTTQLFVGNSTANAILNLGVVTFANSTITSNLTTGQLSIGANSLVNSTTHFVGNSTANAIQNQVTFALANSTISSNLQTGQLNIGANSFINSTAHFVGNSTANSVQTSANFTIANSTGTATLTPTTLTVGLLGGSQINTAANLSFTGANVSIPNANLAVKDLTVSGNLVVTGTLTSVDATNLQVTDSLIKLAKGNAGATLDIGFYGLYNNGADRYTGLMWDASSNIYELYANTTVEPTTTVDTAGLGYVNAVLKAYLNSGALVSNATNLNITANSTLAVALVANTLSLSTALTGPNGGTGLASYTTEDILVANSANGFRKLSMVANKVLQSNGTAVLYDDIDGGTF